jgi:hypothetical protein
MEKFAFKEPQRVISVLNLTTDFLPARKEKISKFPVLKPKITRRYSERSYRNFNQKVSAYYRENSTKSALKFEMFAKRKAEEMSRNKFNVSSPAKYQL